MARESRLVPARIASAALAGVIGLVSLVGLTPVAAHGSVSPPPTPSPTATTLAASSVEIDLVMTQTKTHLPNSPLTVIANLQPQAAWGSVALYDGGTQVASGANYRTRWSYSTSSLSVGRHTFTVRFTPDPASGYAPSRSHTSYAVLAPPAAPVVVEHTKAPAPIVVAVPSVKATKTARPSQTPTPSVAPTRAVEPTSSTRHHSAPKGPMPMTGFEVLRVLAAAAVLLVTGAVMVRLGRRRRRTHSA